MNQFDSPPTEAPQTLAPRSSTTAQPAAGCAGPLLLLFSISWLIPVAFISKFVTLATTVTPGRAATIAALAGAAVFAGLAVILLLPLALLWKSPPYRGIFQAWALAAGVTALLLPVNLLQADSAQARAVLQIVLLLLYCGLILFFARRASPGALNTDEPGAQAPAYHWWPMAIFTAALVAIPWLYWGAFGSLLDTLLASTLGLALGLTAALLIELFIRPGLRTPGGSGLGSFFLEGMGISITILILVNALALPYGALQLMMLLWLPILGWLIAVMDYNRLTAGSLGGDGTAGGDGAAGAQLLQSRRIAPLAALIGLAIALPLALIDADELLLVAMISTGEMLQWAFFAAMLSAAVLLSLTILTALAVGIGRSWPTGRRLAALLLSLAALGALCVAALVYWGPGQPGWHGERIFIILKDQVDVSQASQIPDLAQRRREVYTQLVQKADSSQANLRQVLDRWGFDYTPYYLVNAIEAPDSPLLRLWLLTRPEVDRVLNSPRLRPLPEPAPSASGSASGPQEPDWNLTMIGADRVWSELGFTGQGIIIGQSDSGVQGDHPELAAAYLGAGGDDNYHWFDPWNSTRQPTDIGGHGTHTLGSILGKRTGVAPGAQWIGCVNLARNLANPALYLDCWQFMLAPFPLDGNPLKDGDPARGAQVLNNSWGCPAEEGCDINTFLDAARALRAAGIFVVASAGNDGPGCDTLNTPPPVYDDTFAVGAVDSSGNLATFSSIGPVTADGSGRVKPDIIAPGVQVLSSMPNSSYETMSGTSMAGPHVAGVVALMWSANPALVGDFATTAEILRSTARPYTGPLPVCPGASDTPSTAAGYGIVDAYAAVKAALEHK